MVLPLSKAFRRIVGFLLSPVFSMLGPNINYVFNKILIPKSNGAEVRIRRSITLVKIDIEVFSSSAKILLTTEIGPWSTKTRSDDIFTRYASSFK